MGYKVKFKETQWDSMFAGLDSGRFDMIANQVGINKDREAKYKFSKPYTYSSGVLVVNKDNKNIKSFDDVKGRKWHKHLLLTMVNLQNLKALS